MPGAVFESSAFMRIEEIMTKQVLAIRPDADAEAAWHQMRTARIHHLVVIDGAQIVGILSDRDLGGRNGATIRKDRQVSELMTPHAIVAAPETSLRRAAQLLRGCTIGCLPVVDGKTLVGIVTATDLLDQLAKPANGKRAPGTARDARPSRPRSRAARA